ncbi:MAG TPA: acyl-CoA dehydrogenase, partial [Allosphingosinicella sp.]
YLTDKGFEAAVHAQQVLGGHGYIREHGMEQFVRDARITQIYEGTNGIQAMDLVGRKLGKDGGRAIQQFFKIVATEVAEAKGSEATKDFAAALEKANGELQTATMWLMQNGMANPNNAGAAAYPYMTLMGIVSLGLMWLRMVKASSELLAAGTEDKAFHEAKLITARFFAERIMPDAGALRRKIEGGAESIMALPVEAF